MSGVILAAKLITSLVVSVAPLSWSSVAGSTVRLTILAWLSWRNRSRPDLNDGAENNKLFQC